MVAEEKQQLTHLDKPMNLDNPILIEAQIDWSNATPSPPNEIDYTYMFTFFKKKIEYTNAKQTDELQKENTSLQSIIDELTKQQGKRPIKESNPIVP